MEKDQTFEQIMAVRIQYEKQLMAQANVIGTGVGFKYKRGKLTNDLAVIVNVTKKKPLTELAKKDVVPTELEGVLTDVQEVGKIRAL